MEKTIDKILKLCYNTDVAKINGIYAGVAELADALDLESSVSDIAGSTPVTRTKKESRLYQILTLFNYISANPPMVDEIAKAMKSA